jgi:hypothetical protein
MSPNQPDQPTYEVTGGGSWRAEVGARLEELSNRLAAVPPNEADVQMQATKVAVRKDLDRAFKATREDGSPLGSWFSGSSLTKAWEAVHNAERALLKIETDAAVLAAVPPILSWARRAMDADAIREEHEATLKAELSQARTAAPAGVEGLAPPPDRTKIRGALSDVIAANRLRYADVRTFRNNLIIATVLLIVGLLLIAAWHAHDPHFLSLCAEPESKSKECLTGGPDPKSADIWKVLLVGALGGVLGFVFRLSGTTGADRFDPKTWQRLLKPVTGAAAALAGVVFLQSGLLVESTIGNTELALLGYALIFGFSQQVLTKFVDGRAESLVKPAAK